MKKTAKLITVILLTGILIISLWVNTGVFSSLRRERANLWEDEGFFATAQKTIAFIDAQFNDNIPGRNYFIEANGLFQRLALKHYVQDVSYDRSIIKDNNGFLHFRGWMYSPTQFQPQPLLESYLAFYQHLESENIPLLFITTPEKYIEGYTKFPPTIVNYGNDIQNGFISTLEGENLPYLDLRQEITQSHPDKDTLFYKTDHHWTSYGSFLGFQAIAKSLNQEFGFQLDANNFFRQIENYAIDEYPASFIGSQGRRVGKYYSGVDDFTLIHPNFPTEYNLEISGKEPREGDFLSALIFKDSLEDTDIYANKYAAYLGGDYALATITNNLQPRYKLLIIKDSFTNPAAAFLSTCVSEIKLVDLRYYEGSLYELASQYRPDAVLVLYNSSSITKSTFEFDKK